jgi:hypothetical protein
MGKLPVPCATVRSNWAASNRRYTPIRGAPAQIKLDGWNIAP